MAGAIRRVIVVVLDGVGAGELPDAAQYGDVGSNTLANTARIVGGLNLPTMATLGLGRITPIEGVPADPAPIGCFGKMAEASPGKDTITGHWEIAGVVLDRPFPTYPNGFPPEVIEAFEEAIGTPVAGNYAASGTVIIRALGQEHVLTRWPIVYTSADSVFQIAMHELVYTIEEQYTICEIARRLLTGEHQVGRVICRPFIGSGDDPAVERLLEGGDPAAASGPFRRTERRKDFPVDPPTTVLDELIAAGGKVHAIGKIAEIFNGRGISTHAHTTNNADHIVALHAALDTDSTSEVGEFIFANLEDFDMLYGHRNDAPGLAAALESWDSALPCLLEALRPGDLFVVTADHGNDPTTPSTDHSREYPFLVAYGPGLKQGVDLGIRNSYSDIAATIREAFGLQAGKVGASFLQLLLQ